MIDFLNVLDEIRLQEVDTHTVSQPFMQNKNKKIIVKVLTFISFWT